MLWHVFLQVSIPCHILKDMVTVNLAVRNEVSQMRTELHTLNINVLEALKKNTPEPIAIEPLPSLDNNAQPSTHKMLSNNNNDKEVSREMSQCSVAAYTKARDLIFKSVLTRSLGVEREASTIACHLADLYFGPKVLGESNLTGRNGMQILDVSIIEKIRIEIRKHLGTRVSDEKYADIWRRCRDSISTKCKHARRPSISKIFEIDWLQQANTFKDDAANDWLLATRVPFY